MSNPNKFIDGKDVKCSFSPARKRRSRKLSLEAVADKSEIKPKDQ